MKALIATSLVLASLNAAAVSIPVFETDTYNTVTGSFGINEEMGRAWIELQYGASNDENWSYDRVKVDGLSIVAGSVVLDVDGQQVECAKIKTIPIFRTRVARETGNCKFTSKVETRIHDDGFETRKVRVQVISLTTK